MLDNMVGAIREDCAGQYGRCNMRTVLVNTHVDVVGAIRKYCAGQYGRGNLRTVLVNMGDQI